MYHKTRAEELAFLKRLWSETPTVCPKCGQAELVFLHKKAKGNTAQLRCANCEARFFVRLYKKIAGLLSQGKRFWCSLTE